MQHMLYAQRIQSGQNQTWVKKCMNWPDVSKLLRPYKQCGTGNFPYSLLGIQLPTKKVSFNPLKNTVSWYIFNEATYFVFGIVYFYSLVGIQLPTKKVSFNPLILFVCIFSSIRQHICYFGCCILYSHL